MSARLDGEDPGLAAEIIDEHLAECRDCTAWLAGAKRLTGMVSIGDPPDRTEQIMAAVAADPVVAAKVARHRAVAQAHARRQVLRLAVAVAALVQLALAVPPLFGMFEASGVSPHPGREMASFDIAVAVGFLLAAWRPAQAQAFVLVALVLAGCLAGTSTIDILHGATSIGHELGHLVVVVQAGLLWALGLREKGAPPRVPQPQATGTAQ
jgi:predicted anti-sigma-YlaC factor YlaD